MKYFACLTRFWRESENTPWRVTLEDPHTNAKQNFSSPEQYWGYLQTILAGSEIDQTNNEETDILNPL